MSPNRLPGLLALLLVSLLAAAGCQDQPADSAQTPACPPGQAEALPAVKVEVSQVEPTTLHDVLVLPGATEAVDDVRLASERDGVVEWVGPQEGEEVEKGQLIAKIDVATAQAALERAQASYDLAKHLAQRRQALRSKGALPQEELERALTELTVAENNLREAKLHLDKGFVRSPIKGVVNKLYVDPGEWAAVGAPVADLVNVEKMRIYVNAPELDVRYLNKGDQARISVDAFAGDTWTGVVDFVSFKGDPATKTFPVRVVVDNQDRRIRPGMIARVYFLRRMVPLAVSAPLFAIVDRGGERLVFVVEDGVARARTVELGVLEQDRVQITKGLEPGDQLIVKGQRDVEEGMKVVTQ